MTPNPTAWQKSSYCGSNACVEVAQREEPGYVWVRNSRSPQFSIAFTDDEWAVFVRGVKNGEFD